MFRVLVRERRRRLPSLRIVALTVDVHLLVGQLVVAQSYAPQVSSDTICELIFAQEPELNWPAPEQLGTIPVVPAQ